MKFTIMSPKNRAAKKKARLMAWHNWWAWTPVKVEDINGNFTVYWLTRVMRRFIVVDGYGSQQWQYKESEFDILKEIE